MMSMFAFFMFAGIEAINDSAHVLGMIGSAMDKIDQLKQASFIDGNGKDLSIGTYDICFQHVDFGYESGKRIIHDVNFTARQGTTTAIVGPSGSGKTTICNLIARFYDVNSGAIRVDGQDIRDFNRSELRENFGMVLQDTWLFHGTIMENIRYGRLDATDEEVIAAAKAAQDRKSVV